MTPSFRVRDAGADDLPVLEAMLFEAFFWRPDRERPQLDAHRTDAEFQKWVGGFGARAGDCAVVAERLEAGVTTPVGAAFHRLFSVTEHSYGFIDETTPEIAIGVAVGARGEGVGRALMEALVARARDAGMDVLSLSVEPDNFARRLYERLGFEHVTTVGGAWTMKLSLAANVGVALSALASNVAAVSSALASNVAVGATLAIAMLAITGCGGPFYVFPGGALSGEVATESVADWSSVDDRFLDLEVRPNDPYSVELNYFVRGGHLYIDPAEGRTWLEYLREEPHVRVRFGDTIHPVTAVLVAEPGKRRTLSEIEDLDPDRFIYRLDSRAPGPP